jgi:hypothetical protein
MKNTPGKATSIPEAVLLLLTIALLWGGFVSFGQFVSAQGFYTVSWKWQLGSVLIAAVFFLVSLSVLLGLISSTSKTWKIYVSIRNQLEQKPKFLLAFSLLVLTLSIAIFLFHRIRGLLGINLFSLLLLWLFLLPIFLFIFPFLNNKESSNSKKSKIQTKKDSGFLRRLEKFFTSMGKWNVLWMGLLFAIYIISFFTPWSLFSLPSWLAILLYLPLALLFNLGMRAMFPEKSWEFNFIASLFLIAAGAILVSNFTQVSNDPFSLGWSEGTWIFNGSLFFAKLLYGTHLNPPIIQANRAVLQSIPFLLYPTAPLWLHRLWQAILWSLLPLTFGVLFSKRLGLSGFLRFVFIAWIFLFLQQGPVYYFLFLAPILILLAGKFPRFWIATLVVVVASVWNGIERVNWFALPGCLMALLYILETSYRGKFWSYWWKPIVWIVGGTFVAFSARYGLWLVSGYPGSYFLTTVNSGLLTYRLLPNSTNPTGILPMIVLAILPLSAILIAFINKRQNNLHWSRRWVLLGIILVFFLGGMLVSVKIGGGNNLHNFDAFLLLISVSCSMFFFEKVIPDLPGERMFLGIPAWLLCFIALLPLLFSFSSATPLFYSKTNSQSALDEINQRINSLPSNSLPVLFISQNQLLATGLVKNVVPQPAYELELMMEMAMANNLDYLKKLYGDLSNQRYSLIVAPELNTFQKGPGWEFGEENDAWNNTISVLVLRYYHPIFDQKDFGFEILVPNEPNGK